MDNQCQQQQIQIITKYYSEYDKKTDSPIYTLLQQIFTELDQLQSKCLEENCWVDGKEQCEKSTLQSCIKNNDFWMAACKPGYKPLGKTSSICIEKCPQGFIEDGEQCIKPNSYSRGVGYSWIPQDGPFSVVKSQLRCNKENPNTSCEQLYVNQFAQKEQKTQLKLVKKMVIKLLVSSLVVLVLKKNGQETKLLLMLDNA
ncbi:hypothetical protein ABPG73_008794 [Tetrahymena malaccensis]